ncbi:hypothetical protein [Blastococcus sp. SYSU DS0617]
MPANDAATIGREVSDMGERSGRRLLAVVLLALALVGVTVGPAAAAFSATASVSTGTIRAATVPAPGAVQAVRAICSDGWIPVYSGRISWTPSAARDVTGYTVRQHFADGSSTVVARQAAGDTSASHLVFAVGRSYVYSVTTETAYGWTTRSDLTAPVTC